VPNTTAPALAAFGPIPTGKLAAARTADLQKIIDSVVADGEPDVIAAVITPDGTWAGAAGVGGPNRTKVAVDDEFSIASITKTFTAALILRLVEKGVVELDAPLASYLGDLGVHSNGATVREALGMRAGLPDSRPGLLDIAYADPDRPWTPAEIVTFFDAPSPSSRGSYAYSNPTYKLLGFAAEHVTGKPLAVEVRDRLLSPVGASRIIVQGPDGKTPKPWALPLDGHLGGRPADSFGRGGALPSLADATFSAGAAGMASDAPSLAAWGWHLFAGDILTPASVGVMATVDGAGDGQGLDRFYDFGKRVAYGRAGTKSGYASLLVAFPDERAIVVAFINDEEGDTITTARRLIDAVSPG
jgi:CubicO group peptidase (beta-lactamase class C family)